MKKLIILLITLLLIVGCEDRKQEDNEEINLLISDLSDSDYDVRQQASDSLVEIGEEAVPYVIESLENDPYDDDSSQSFNSRWNKVNVLGRIGDQRAEDVLIDRHHDNKNNTGTIMNVLYEGPYALVEVEWNNIIITSVIQKCETYKQGEKVNVSFREESVMVFPE